ncbi:hypothetical protein ONZ43_g3711 [Nemania bipapillata]|uniref:Uncharacterized protein n=1 Tax=Nemania bipapillata TaxID=110536 RepID=A0ACC2IVT6_9PEZI|nr:hypothetical protein ONZ43_g3711 [Nemania bipapillata]
MSLEAHAAALTASLATANLAPGSAASLIGEGFRPTTKLEVNFGERVVELGNFFRAGECKQAPKLAFAPEADAPEGASYILVLTDPDAPTPDDPKFAFWRHWVLSGLRPLGVDTAVAASELTAYLGPGPKDDSKPHRYLFLLYREPEGLSLSKKDVGGEEFVQRRSFKPAEFAGRHGLRLVGVNWMYCAGDGWTEDFALTDGYSTGSAEPLDQLANPYAAYICGHAIAPAILPMGSAGCIRDAFPLTMPEGGPQPSQCKECRWRQIQVKLRYALDSECVMCAQRARAGVAPKHSLEHEAHYARHLEYGIGDVLGEIMMLVQPEFITRNTKESAQKAMEEGDRRRVNVALLKAMVFTELEGTVWNCIAMKKLTGEQARRHAAGVRAIECYVLDLLMANGKNCRRMW